MRPINPPDFTSGQISEENSIYHIVFNPETDEFDPIAFSEKYEEKNWCGNITCHKKGEGRYHIYDFFYKGPALASWYLLNDPDSKMAQAVYLNGQWYLLEKGEECIMAGDKESYAVFREMLTINLILLEKGEDPKIILRVNKR